MNKVDKIEISLEETMKYHKILWEEISEFFRNSYCTFEKIMEIRASITYRGYLNLLSLIKEYVLIDLIRRGKIPDKFLDNSFSQQRTITTCFLCFHMEQEYIAREYRFGSSLEFPDRCVKYCPCLDPKICFTGCLNGLYSELIDLTGDIVYLNSPKSEIAAELALEIANLPVANPRYISHENASL